MIQSYLELLLDVLDNFGEVSVGIVAIEDVNAFSYKLDGYNGASLCGVKDHYIG